MGEDRGEMKNEFHWNSLLEEAIGAGYTNVCSQTLSPRTDATYKTLRGFKGVLYARTPPAAAGVAPLLPQSSPPLCPHVHPQDAVERGEAKSSGIRLSVYVRNRLAPSVTHPEILIQPCGRLDRCAQRSKAGGLEPAAEGRLAGSKNGRWRLPKRPKAFSCQARLSHPSPPPTLNPSHSGNKGAVAFCMRLNGARVAFITAHLNAHMENVSAALAFPCQAETFVSPSPFPRMLRSARATQRGLPAHLPGPPSSHKAVSRGRAPRRRATRPGLRRGRRQERAEVETIAVHFSSKQNRYVSTNATSLPTPIPPPSGAQPQRPYILLRRPQLPCSASRKSRRPPGHARHRPRPH